jgi:MHS family proline/betaine transporter-like MFS transporter
LSDPHHDSGSAGDLAANGNMMRSATGHRHTTGTLLAGVVGNVIEWYDFALYGYFAPVLANVFFSAEDSTTALIATYAVFAGGFVMRPLGAVLFGYIGDRISRRSALFLSVILMAIPTFLLGTLPTYAQVGAIAAVLLICVRLVQGISVGGEFSGSVTYVVETAPQNRRGLAGSWANVGSMAGTLVGSSAAMVVVTCLPEADVEDWGWRVPFLLGGVLGVVGLLLRRGLSPSELFEEHEARHAERSPLAETLTDNIRETTQAIVFASAYGVVFYVAVVYLPTYASEFGNISLERALQANTIGIFVLLAIIPLMGLASDVLLRRKTMLVAAFLLAGVSAYGLLDAAVSDQFIVIVASQLILGIVVAVPMGAAPASLVELFPTEDRLTGYSLSFNLGLGIFGGTTPMICTWLIDVTGNTLAPAYYMAGCALVAVAALISMRDRSREALR